MLKNQTTKAMYFSSVEHMSTVTNSQPTNTLKHSAEPELYIQPKTNGAYLHFSTYPFHSKMSMI